MSNSTIAALSTPAGSGGIAVIRISGDSSRAISDKVFKAFSGKKISELQGYSALYGEIIKENTAVDDCVALFFKAPKSYTGEDVVELSVHGGTEAALQTLRLLYAAGAAPAKAGEFTERAFLNGKIDLTRAESIMGIISAKSEAALRLSASARKGYLCRDIEDITEKLLSLSASLSVYADYPDEEIENLNPENFSMLLESSEKTLENLLNTYDAGKIIREGIDCCIVGKPNVGKSTLMNMLARFDRSIVTDIAGTTRDIVESSVKLGDLLLNLSDTAGIRETADVVEKAGVEKAVNLLKSSSLVLAVFDNSKALEPEDKSLIKELSPDNTIIVLNKSDLGSDLKSLFKGFYTVEISAKSGEGKAALEEAIKRLVKINELSYDTAVLINERQRSCVEKALSAVKEAKITLLEGLTLDAVGVNIDEALNHLLSLTGKRVTNEVCDEIFKNFCVGK